MSDKDEILKIRVDQDFKELVQQFAKKRGESMAVVVREALRSYIADNSNPKPVPTDQVDDLANQVLSDLQKTVDELKSKINKP